MTLRSTTMILLGLSALCPGEQFKPVFETTFALGVEESRDRSLERISIR